MMLKDKKEKINSIIFYLLVLALCCASFHLINLTLPVTDDNLTYMELTEQLAVNHKYASPILNELQGYEFKKQFDWSPHAGVPPMYPLLSVPFYWVMGNVVSAIRLSNMFFNILLVITIFLFARKITGEDILGACAAFIVLCNPVFFYYTIIQPLSESLTLLFIMWGVYLFFFHKDNTALYILSGVCFSLAALTHYPAGAFLIAFSLYPLVNIIKRKEILKHLRFYFFSGIPLLLWVAWNYITFGTLSPFAQGAYSSTAGRWVYAGETSLIMIAGFVLMFQLLIPFVVYGFWKTFRDKNWRYVYIAALIVFLTPILLLDKHGVPFFTAVISYSRYLLPILPLLIIPAVLAVVNYNGRFRLTLRSLAVFSVLIIMGTALIVNYGAVKDMTDSFISLPEIRPQKMYHFDEMIHETNKFAKQDQLVSYHLNYAAFDDVNIFFEDYLRDDLVYVPFEKVNKSMDVLLITTLTEDEMIDRYDLKGMFTDLFYLGSSGDINMWWMVDVHEE